MTENEIEIILEDMKMFFVNSLYIIDILLNKDDNSFFRQPYLNKYYNVSCLTYREYKIYFHENYLSLYIFITYENNINNTLDIMQNIDSALNDIQLKNFSFKFNSNDADNFDTIYISNIQYQDINKLKELILKIASQIYLGENYNDK